MKLGTEAREVALAEVQAVLALARDKEHLARLAAELDAGEVVEEELLESVLELALQTGRIRAYHGPGGEQAALATLRQLPRGRARTASAREVSEALRVLAGKELDAVSIAAIAPGAFTLSLEAGGLETSVRLDHNGARIQSVAA
ncbi:MAG TPA: hypothetical protein VFB25_01420 [Gaiellaceae bacterium]|nr:hypothetical protein [Gaiellaceae bacterium]